MKISNLLNSKNKTEIKPASPVKKVANKIKNAYNFITGGTRKQTYGYSSKHFFSDDLSDEEKKQSKSNSNVTATPIKDLVPEQAPTATTSDISESLDKMFAFLKKSHEENVLQRELAQNFSEETQDNEDRRHGELLEAMRDFTSTGMATQITEKKDEGGGLLGLLKSMYDELKVMMEPLLNFMKTVGNKIIEFGHFLLKNPATISAILYAIGLWKAKQILDETQYGKRMAEGEGMMAEKAFREKQTDLTQLELTKDQAAAILEQDDTPGKKRDIIAFGGIERITAISKGLPDPGGIPLAKKIDLEKPTNQTQEFKDKKKAMIDSLPSTQAQKIIAQQSRASFAQTDERMKLIGTGIQQKTVTPAPIPPKTDALNKVTSENNNLNTSAIAGITPAPKPVIISNDTGTTVNDKPISSEATQRDNTPILDRVMGRLKAAF